MGSARQYLIGGGVIYLVLFVYGLVVGEASAANFVPLNSVDNGLHLLLGHGMVALDFLVTRDDHHQASVRTAEHLRVLRRQDQTDHSRPCPGTEGGAG